MKRPTTSKATKGVLAWTGLALIGYGISMLDVNPELAFGKIVWGMISLGIAMISKAKVEEDKDIHGGSRTETEN